jgi:hypothetical protein
MSDGEMVDLVVRGMTRKQIYTFAQRVHLDSDDPMVYALNRACRMQVAEWECEERDAMSYTDEDGVRIEFGSSLFPRLISIIDGDRVTSVVLDHDELLRIQNAKRAKDGLPRLVEESGVVSAEEHAAVVTARDELLAQITYRTRDRDTQRVRAENAEAERDGLRQTVEELTVEINEQWKRAEEAVGRAEKAERERDRMYQLGAGWP